MALVGKYAGLKECYKSLAEALVHGGIDHETRVNIHWIESEDIERQGTERILREADGILIPGGFGARGIEGKITTIRFARERQMPFLGLCLGMQCATIEFARHVAGLAGANSAEFDERSPHPVIHLMHDQQSRQRQGRDHAAGKLSLPPRGGHARPQDVRRERSVVNDIDIGTNSTMPTESNLTAKGLVLSGLSPDGRLVEIVELKDHPWFLATQFHPEY